MIYTYYCKGCEIEFVKHLSIADRNNPTTKRCKECGQYNIIKVIESPFFRVHGFAARNGYSDTVGDIEKFTGHEYRPEEDD